MSKEFTDAHTLIAYVAEHYQYHKSAGLVSGWQESINNFLTKFFEHLANILAFSPGFTETHIISNIIRWLLYGSGLIGAFLLVWHILLRASGSKQAQSVKLSTTLRTKTGSSQSWHNQAIAFSSARNWKHACRALLLAVLSLLDENKIVPFITTCSNYEYWYALSQHKNIQSVFKLLADNVDYSWFGDNKASEDDFRRCVTYFETIQSFTDRNNGTK